MPHPILLAVVITDLSAMVLLLLSGVTAGRVVMGWRPGSADSDQLALERRVEAASLQGRGAFALLLVGTVLLVAAIASVLPDLVPGAMCGTGVLQAMGPAAERALLLRGLALVALAVWHHLDRLDHTQPEAPLALASARASLVALPVAALAVIDTAGPALALDVAQTVDCCSVVFDAARAHGAAAGGAGTASTVPWAGLTAVGGVAILALAGAAATTDRARRSGPVRLTLAALALVWVPVAAVGLTRELSAYHYGVLAHDCPYCLFAVRHRLVGYPLFGALALVALEAPAALVGHLAARRKPELAPAASKTVRRASLRVALASILFLGLALGPALWWRLRHGVWIDS